MENNKRRALGRGLEELFYNEPIAYDKVEEKILTETPKEEIQNVKIADLRSNPYQPRQVFNEEALQELASSIKEHGVFQPIIIKKSIKGYEIIAGERRVKASKIAGLEEIPAIIRDFSDEEMMEIALLENLQRENLNPMEESRAYKKLIETLNITQEELAKKLGKSRSYITNMIGLQNLPNQIQDFISENKMSMGHARVLSKLENEDQQKELAEKVISDGMSVRELEKMTQSTDRYQRTHKINRTTPKTNEYQYLEDDLCEKLGTKVKIKSNKIEISFVNGNDLNRLLEIMNLETRR
ncbi:MAG TPA: ParB/RepB/Spo0J family partition protein [Candidatus Faecimonas gallistercoris]|nr:ParB/RepB/Spo0J family partition protein [Candidatus Faecimonas gallistercoris]